MTYVWLDQVITIIIIQIHSVASLVGHNKLMNNDIELIFDDFEYHGYFMEVFAAEADANLGSYQMLYRHVGICYQCINTCMLHTVCVLCIVSDFVLGFTPLLLSPFHHNWEIIKLTFLF